MKKEIIISDYTGLTPLEIEILLFYHYSSESSTDYPLINTSGAHIAMERFVRHGIMKLHTPTGENPKLYIPNRECMDVYIKAITSVPLPTQRWDVDLAF